MVSHSIMVIGSLGMVGLGCGSIILLVRRLLPEEDKNLQKAEEIEDTLPGVNCGACGSPSCFGYAQKLAGNPEEFNKNPCMTLMKDQDNLKEFEEKIDAEISTEKMNKVAIIHCIGESKTKNDYKGISTCAAASQLSSGYKECPYGCLGLGDCVEVCPENAISIDAEKNIAVIDEEKCIGCGLCAEECSQDIIEIVPSNLPQYLGCSYEAKKDIDGRKKCEVGCLHCRLCLNESKEAVKWNEDRDLPDFVEKNSSAPKAVDKCPKDVIIPLSYE